MAENSRRFVSELSEALRRGLEHGELTDEDLEPLLQSPDFEPGAFDLFLAEARRQSVKLPEGSRLGEAPPPEALDHSIGSLERRYMKEIQRYPLLERDQERALWEAMQPFSTGGVYVNYLGQEADEGAERVKAAYGSAKYERLVALKNKYDPTNFFRLNQNIKPTV